MGYLSDITSKLDKDQNIIFVGTGVILINKQNEILLARRTDNKLWSLPGGSLEVGERLEECIVRETLEETGIQIEERNLHLNSAKSITEPVIKNGRSIYVVSVTYWVKLESEKDIKIESREFSNYKWFSVDNLSEIKDEITSYSKSALDEYETKRL